MNRFFYIQRTQTWVNLKDIIAVFRDGMNWAIVLTNDLKFTINDEEYTELIGKINDIEDDWREGREERKKKHEHKD